MPDPIDQFLSTITTKLKDFDQRLSNLESSDPTLKNNWSATSDPTVNDDSGDGYAAGSLWINTSGARVFVCVDATAGAADWDQIN